MIAKITSDPEQAKVILGQEGEIPGYYQSWFSCYNCQRRFNVHIKMGTTRIAALEVLMKNKLVCQNCGCEAFPSLS